MRALSKSVLLALPLILSGCVSSAERSDARWYKLSSGPVAEWTLCINEQSHKWLQLPADDLEWSQVGINPGERAGSAQLFSEVVSQCRSLMKGNAWDTMPDKQFAELLSDAYWHFNRIELNVETSKLEPTG
jgi:hypothetical protein